MFRRFISLLIYGICMSFSQGLLAELPLPDFTLYGQIATSTGAPVTAGDLKAKVRRGEVTFLDAAGEFKAAEGAHWYVVRIPLETGIGAPGPSGVGANEGDTLEALLLDGRPLDLKSSVAPLLAGALARVDAATTGPAGPRYARGDCNGDAGVDVSDAVRMLFFLFISPAAPPCLEACDSDGNEAVQVTDAVHVLTYQFLKGPPPPPPGAQCGVDPAPSALGCLLSPCPGA